MKKALSLLLIMLWAVSLQGQADQERHSDKNMITKTSKNSYNDTQTKLESALQGKDLKLFAKIDHTAGANQVGLQMLPETLFIFGNPKGGTQFMVAAPTAAIDLPLKAIVWQNKEGKVLVTYNTMEFLVQRHNITGLDDAVKKLDGVLDAVTDAATN